MALDYFRRGKAEIAVVEVGLGGTYDSTRIVRSILSVLTRVDLDHTDRLGKTLDLIAADKAGIFRAGIPALTSDQQSSVSDVLKARAQEIGAPFLRARNLVSLASVSITSRQVSGTAVLKYPHPSVKIKRWKCPMVGLYQVENVRLALAASSLLMESFPGIDANAMVRGIQTVNWPGRLQVLQKKPPIIVDVAHNPGAVRAVLASIHAIWKPRRIIAIFSALKDKDIPAMIVPLKAAAAEAFVVPLPPPRGLSLDEITVLAKQMQWNARPAASVSEAMKTAISLADRQDLILAIGSHYLAEEVLKNQKFP